ncbi:MAG: hypothetical protein RI911_306 [Candidatus Parcubacteria bacterium]
MVFFGFLAAVIAACTYGSLQWEVSYYNTSQIFYINMLTHFLGGMFTGAGSLFLREVVNFLLRKIEVIAPFVKRFEIPRLPIWALVVIVLIVGLVWELWEFYFRASVLLTVDTAKDVIMDMCGAYIIGRFWGNRQYD